VSDEAMMSAVHILLEKAKTLAELAGAAPLAAVLEMRQKIQGKKIAIILSGGNISPEQLKAILIG
jgi:threonine dehydratase